MSETTAVHNSTLLQPPWFAPILWPLINLLAFLRISKRSSCNSNQSQKKVHLLEAHPFCSLLDHATALTGSVRSLILAAICLFVLHGGTDPTHGYPAYGKASSLEWRWMISILARNIIGTWIIAGSWDWLLYLSPWSKIWSRFKMNPSYPPWSQLRHDALYTTLASFIASCIEIVLCHFWANERMGLSSPLATVTYSVLLQGITLTYWRNVHFYIVHRLMHPWRISILGNFDPGYYLYKFAHSLHHKSNNPTAFSGTSMHPVEASLYYSAALIPFLLFSSPIHPLIPLSAIIDCGVAAWLGHDGFQWPGSGDFFHLLHHQYFDCNYGTPIVPLDYYLGTFASCKSDVKKMNTMRQVERTSDDKTDIH